jgi:hyaluronan synthase
MNQTGWGTSARSSSERKRGTSFMQRSFQVGHLVIWYTGIFVGLGFFIQKMTGNPIYWLLGAIALLLSVFLYWERSISLGGLRGKFSGLFSKEKKATPEEPTDLQVDESALPSKPDPIFDSSMRSSCLSTKRSSGTTLQGVPATPSEK